MLGCHACIRTVIRAVFSDALEFSRLPRLPASVQNSIPSRRTPPWQPRRRHATVATAVEALPRRADTSNQPFAGGIGKQVTEYKKTHLEKELVYLKDPVKLADHTVGLLRQRDPQKALEIVRLGSKRMRCTVSWNHIIDYEMSTGRVNNAMKLYNEVRKQCITKWLAKLISPR